MTPPLSFAAKPTLTGQRVILRAVTVDDATGLAGLIRDPEVRRLTGTHLAVGPAAIDGAREWYGSRDGQDDRLDLAIVDPSTDRYVGEVVLKGLDADNGSCEFRIAIGPAAVGRGYGTDATRLILAHAFETVGVHRIGLEVYAFNPRARRVYEKVGFVREGTRRDALRWDGGWVDADIMAVLADEWAGHRGRPALAPVPATWPPRLSPAGWPGGTPNGP